MKKSSMSMAHPRPIGESKWLEKTISVRVAEMFLITVVFCSEQTTDETEHVKSLHLAMIPNAKICQYRLQLSTQTKLHQ